jgi:hypothetical protein
MRFPRLVRPSPAFVVSVVALMVALGGTSYAAFSLPRNSVGSKQLKRNAVTNAKIHNGAVGSAKIKNGAISASKIGKGAISAVNLNLTKLGTVPSATNSGFATNAGHATTADSATNATNATNAKNADTSTAMGSVSYVITPTITAPACGTGPPCTSPSDTPGTATCPAGTTVIAGGVETSAGGEEINESIPETGLGSTVPNEWHAFVDNFTNTDHNFNVVAICTKVANVDNPTGLSKKAPSSR